ncbi:hypothetical protein SAMN05421767_11118 [Granulicatella balaenopterae]|uniref:Uncharacterized protein n=1 Tax=Granulicatella balaenopterae TaxID=137733 RepID=A0A1H9JZQ4_9LACT|nr:hypothetical protein [Granulicatella balaenopterae]SEQ92257.1 hypothetical protein SAMN05421767_11118 [Granulicatella balaenopterae]
MKKVMTGLRFIFRNGETWTIDRKMIGDLWIKQVTTSFGRINGSEFQEIHPCESLRIEIFPEADHVMSEDINLGGLELGMFDRVQKYRDIEMMDILYSRPEAENTGHEDRIYFPYKPIDEDGNDNHYQSSKVGVRGHLFIVIDPQQGVDDLYPNN